MEKTILQVLFNKMRNVSLIFILFLPSKAFADCLPPTEEQSTLAIQSCRLINSYEKWRILYLASFNSPASVKNQKDKIIQTQNLIDGYQGAIIKGTKSNGFSGQFFYPSIDEKVCDKFKKNISIKVKIAAACCEPGDLSSPCYFGEISTIIKTSDK